MPPQLHISFEVLFRRGFPQTRIGGTPGAQGIRVRGAQGAGENTPIFAAVAAGKARGGYDSVFDAARDMGKVKNEGYRPRPENVPAYDALYAEYKLLHDYFGRGENDVMKRLKKRRAAR